MKLAYKVAIGIFVLIVLFGAMLLYLLSVTSAIAHGAQGNVTSAGPVTLSVSINQSRLLSYNSSNTPLVYALASYITANATSASVSLDVYTRNPIIRIYLVNVTNSCVSCVDENALNSGLLADLVSHNLIRNASSFSYIPLASLGSTAPNSIIVVPSGLIPVTLLNGSVTIFTLLARGDTVIYTGQNFTRSVGSGGLILVNPPSILSELSTNSLMSIPLNAYIKPPKQQQVTVNFTFSNPTFVFASGYKYANITYVNSGNGTVIAFPNYPRSSWSSAAAVANDIAGAINSRLWIPSVGHSSFPLSIAARQTGNIGVFAAILSLSNRTSPYTYVNGSYSLLTFTASNQKGNATSELFFKNAYRPGSVIGIPGTVGETQSVPILIQVNSSASGALFHVDVYDRNLSYVGAIPIGFVSSSFGAVKYHTFGLPSGYYLLGLKDFGNSYYAGAFFDLAPTLITPTQLDFSNATFIFSVQSYGVPVTNTTYKANINGAYTYTGAINNGTLVFKLPKGTIINYGNETFNFQMLGMNVTYFTSYTQKVLNIPTIYIEFGIAIVVVVLLNLILKPPIRDEYYIDVPEFPPSKSEKVRVQKNSVLGVFDKVNYYYHWKYMPLTGDEVKSGIGNNVRVNNMPISITMQNANLVLSTLMQDGQVAMSNGYYAPKAWLDASGHSLDYLIIFRKLRDYCVSHAILFTDLDSNNTADMLITKDSKQTSVFIYTAKTQMRRITLSKESRIIIVFMDEDATREFTDELYSSIGKEAEILKLGIEYNYVRLVDTDHLDQLAF